MSRDLYGDAEPYDLDLPPLVLNLRRRHWYIPSSWSWLWWFKRDTLGRLPWLVELRHRLGFSPR